VEWQEASPANINTLSPEPEDEDEEMNNNVGDDDDDDDRTSSYAASPLYATGAFDALALPNMSHVAGEETYNPAVQFHWQLRDSMLADLYSEE